MPFFTLDLIQQINQKVNARRGNDMYGSL